MAYVFLEGGGGGMCFMQIMLLILYHRVNAYVLKAKHISILIQPSLSFTLKVEVEKQVLDSREKLEYYRTKMQDLVSTIKNWM